MEPQLFLDADRVEKKHWWFAGRREIISSVIRNQITLPPQAKILDVGCGTGGNLEFLGEYGEVTGVDPSETALEIASKKMKGTVVRGSLPDQLPFSRESFDLITLLDVLEHVENDDRALTAIASLLKPGGFLCLTVPAFSFLWSAHDAVHSHFRRYTLRELSEKLIRHRFHIKFANYFNIFLFPVIALIRILGRHNKNENEVNLEIPPKILNEILRQLFSFERHLLGRIRFPFGISIIVCAQKGV